MHLYVFARVEAPNKKRRGGQRKKRSTDGQSQEAEPEQDASVADEREDPHCRSEAIYGLMWRCGIGNGERGNRRACVVCT